MISTASPAISLARCSCSSPWAAGTMKYSTPTCCTADTFCASPPIAPTEPSRLISPVTATSAPPVRLPADSSSISVSVNARPADGPPMRPVSIVISNGSWTLAVSNG